MQDQMIASSKTGFLKIAVCVCKGLNTKGYWVTWMYIFHSNSVNGFYFIFNLQLHCAKCQQNICGGQSNVLKPAANHHWRQPGHQETELRWRLRCTLFVFPHCFPLKRCNSIRHENLAFDISSKTKFDILGICIITK